MTATSSSGRQLIGADLALAGIGKIARDQHVPAIETSEAFTLAATVSHSGGLDGMENHAEIEDLIADRPDIGIVSLTMPPLPRFDYAMKALAAGKHVMLEKPPGATLSEVHKLQRLAQAKGVTLYASWHVKHAPGVAAARAWLRDRTVTGMRITWHEDVRVHHPGQDWIWEPAGLGVFDTGVNALSIMVEILPVEVHLREADLKVPGNRQMPIAAKLDFAGPGDMKVTADFDFRHEDPPTWDMEIDTTDGPLKLLDAATKMIVNGQEQALPDQTEYGGVYHRFAELIETGQSDVDLRPFRHVADAMLLGTRETVADFHHED
ncbi:Gfo/Idh/MocA family oxidoreductase [Salipiger sp. IMCC34102]|uniref:Gfo/Idh/MocA family protein n=1 Tax=Salipiger sp. IMCC34102 TaxID=2510647 RepID=UPI00101B97F3|nr:Gfo/Idh/MocA family oxidoreductase [Salipiger sp. IMCC34102]RYH03547.1 Gfo/Idh/MocA family oxidoreductase [Salipiger sp. IMCC34102]